MFAHLKKIVHAWPQSILDAIFPPTCVACDDVLLSNDAAPLCGECAGRVPWLNHQVWPSLESPAWDDAWAVTRFEGPLVAALHAFKYANRVDLTRGLSQLLARLPLVALQRDDCVLIPVPLAMQRLRMRGYNQSLLLARALSKKWRTPVFIDRLRRVRETPPQVGLEAAARKDNMRGAFAWCGASHALRNQHVILIDDVLTTGATLNACARVLRNAGAEKISVAVVAMA